ncbi:hypothetical protein O1Q74_18665 [Pectobacterium sp. A5351]|nr:hypothetical protein [Pectobacterium sp. A5351]WCG82872.1 hypothetical protein O1Q74_18665 [Pectobacterium sp. A5351]
MDSLQRRNLILLALGQGLTGSIISLMTLCSTLVDVSITPVPLLTTLPITATVCGTALMYGVFTRSERLPRPEPNRLMTAAR